MQRRAGACVLQGAGQSIEQLASQVESPGVSDAYFCSWRLSSPTSLLPPLAGWQSDQRLSLGHRCPSTILHGTTRRRRTAPQIVHGASSFAFYTRRMRSRLNLALVVAAGAFALVLTVIRQSPEGVVSIELNTQEVRAAPGEVQPPRHDLSALKIFNMTLLRIKDRYVDPARVDPRKMLYAALDSVQFNIPEVLVEPDPVHNRVRITVNDKPETFDTDDVDSPWRLASKLKKVFRFIETNMNAGGDLAKVEYAAVNGMLSTLDPHSILMDPEQARDMDVSTSGKFGGLGIVIRMIEKKLTVVKPMKDTPAWRKGIKAGDHIVRINQEPTENLTSNEAVDRMRGDPRTGVTLYIERKGVDGVMRFDLIRDLIRVRQVEHKLLSLNEASGNPDGSAGAAGARAPRGSDKT